MSPLSAHPGNYTRTGGKDSISNLYSIKIANKTTNEIPLTIKLENETGTIEIVGKPYITVVKEGQGAGTFCSAAKEEYQGHQERNNARPLRRQ